MLMNTLTLRRQRPNVIFTQQLNKARSKRSVRPWEGLMERSVLIVESGTSARLLLTNALKKLGFSYRISTSAAEALELARHHRPDVAIVGSAMGDRAIDRLCREWKLDPRTNPLILIRVEQPGLFLDLDLEPDDWLSLPCEVPTLAEVLDRAFHAAEDRRQDGVRSEIRWRLPSDREVLTVFQDQFRAWMQGYGLNNFRWQQLALAVRELCANAMEWGHSFERERIVSVAARLDAEKISVLVRDSGKGFNPRHVPHAARPGDPISHLEIRAAARIREGGYGILMASGLVDHLVYNDVGNEALAIRFLPHPEADMVDQSLATTLYL